MEMSKSNINGFRGDFARAVKSLEEKYGVTINLGNISYNNAGMHTKLEVKNLDGETGTAMVNPRNEFRARMAFVQKFGNGIGDEPIIGSKWHLWNGGVITISDYDSKKPKYPILYERGGQRFKCSIGSIEGRA